MKGVSEVKSRIGGVRDTIKITRAMYVIAAAKMPRAMEAMAAAERYADLMTKAVSRLACPRYRLNPYLAGNADGRYVGWIVIAGAKGFCGDYNDKVLDEAWRRISVTPDSKVFPVGYMAQSYMAAHGVHNSTAFLHMMQNPLPEDAAQIADRLMDDLVKSKLREVHLVYTAANKLYDQEVVCCRLLPLAIPEQTEDVSVSHPDADIDEMIRSLLTAKLYAALTEASAAYNYKHMTGMQQATKNGEQMLEDLTKTYNHARQAAITAELTDVNVARMANEDKL